MSLASGIPMIDIETIKATACIIGTPFILQANQLAGQEVLLG